MHDLTAQIRAALDEDERIAKDAYATLGTGSGRMHLDDEGRLRFPDSAFGIRPAVSAHILRHPPGRVIAQVAAMRKILELHEIIRLPYPDEAGEFACETCDNEAYGNALRSRKTPWCPTLLALAEAYQIEMPQDTP